MHREIRGEVRLDAGKSGALQHWSALTGGLDRPSPAATAILPLPEPVKAATLTAKSPVSVGFTHQIALVAGLARQ